MTRLLSRISSLFLTAVILSGLSPSLPTPAARASAHAAQPAASAPLADMPYFKYPVVPGAVISGYFDHNPASGIVTFYDGRHNSPGAGFYFNCSQPAMYDWVGCQDAVSGEPACSNSRELWYDEHHGTDYEYSPNWYTGATCDPGRFAGITMPVYAPARGQVLMAGYDPNRPANGWHIRLKHDLNGNGNFNDDNFRSVYLHFTANALAVVPGQIVNEGDYLGLGGSTGYSSSPHLHFEVQRSSDYFQYTYWPVDPYGWQGAGSDPYPYTNVKLWKQTPVSYKYHTRLPFAANERELGNLLNNGGFETGHADWVEQGVQVITQTGDPNLTVSPHSGTWLAWLAGRNSASDTIYQEFVLPEGVDSLKLRYALMVSSEEPGTPNDYLYIRLRQTDNTVLREASYDNTSFTQNQWIQNEMSLTNLSQWAGQTLRISFKGTSNATYLTSFYLDDVELVPEY